MIFHVLAVDYDETLAEHGRVSTHALDALYRLKESGRKMVMVTGRHLPDLLQAFPHFNLFDQIVAENGALLFQPSSNEEWLLTHPPPPTFVRALRRAVVKPLSVGQAIIASSEENRHTVLDVITRLGVEYQLVFNKGSLMVLPSGVNKGTGLIAALDQLSISTHNTVAIGDAENDHTLLSTSHLGVAVGNALNSLKAEADLVLNENAGRGVEKLVELLLTDDLGSVAKNARRNRVVLGRSKGIDGTIHPPGKNMLICGPSGSGKSTLAAGLLERLEEAGYQFVLFDPEGDYEPFGRAIRLGDAKAPPSNEALMEILHEPKTSVIANLFACPLEERPAFFSVLIPLLQKMRRELGHPHWIAVDEAHHLFPAFEESNGLLNAQRLGGLLFITVHPGKMVPTAFDHLEEVLAVGERPREALEEAALVLKKALPKEEAHLGGSDTFLRWEIEARTISILERVPSRFQRKRHKRKYAEGDLREKSFFFRGPERRLNLRAQNLMIFLQLAEGVDEDTWMFHLKRNDYSQWIRSVIKDEILADAIAEIESDTLLSSRESLLSVAELINHSYTIPGIAS